MLKIKQILWVVLIFALMNNNLYGIKTISTNGWETITDQATLKKMASSIARSDPALSKQILQRAASLKSASSAVPAGMVLVTAAQAAQLQAINQLQTSQTLPSGMIAITPAEYAQLQALSASGQAPASGSVPPPPGGAMKRGGPPPPPPGGLAAKVTQAQATQAAQNAVNQALALNPATTNANQAKAVATAIQTLYGTTFKENSTTANIIATAIVASVSAITASDVAIGLREVIADATIGSKAADAAITAATTAITTQASTAATQVMTSAVPGSSNAANALLIANTVMPIYKKSSAFTDVTKLATTMANVIVANISTIDQPTLVAVLTQVLPNTAGVLPGAIGTTIATVAGNAVRAAATAVAAQASAAAAAAEQSSSAWQAAEQAGKAAALAAKNASESIAQQATAAGAAAAQSAQTSGSISDQGIVTLAAGQAYSVSSSSQDAAMAATAAVALLSPRNITAQKLLWSQALVALGLSQLDIIGLNQFAPKQGAVPAPTTPVATPAPAPVGTPVAPSPAPSTPAPTAAGFTKTTAATTPAEMLTTFQATKSLRTDSVAFDAWMNGNIATFAGGTYALSIGAVSYSNLTGLHVALLFVTNLNIVLEILFADTAALDKVDSNRQTPLENLINNYKGVDLPLSMLSHFITTGSINQANNTGQTPLHLATTRLLKAFAAQKTTPTQTAISEFNAWITVISTLVKRGASKAVIDSNGNTPLMLLNSGTSAADKVELGTVIALLT